ncbi:MAG: cytochrome C554 [candidate division Zixibacteria bacterium]|nr:cytochrome C554 [candidate division Zixibacteria bacterium]
MTKKIFVSMLVIGIVCVLAMPVVNASPKYVGVSKCKMCHKMEKYGNSYGVWENSLHAKAFETLGTEKAKENGKKHGIDDPQKSEKCLKCHVTGYDAPADAKAESYSMEEGVTCEACHGPGSDYKSMKIMKDREAAIANGLIVGDKETCLNCHIPEGNDFYVEFDYEKFYEKIKHEIPEE